jgi:hypothetical protein
MPVATTTTDQNRFLGSNEEEEDDDDDHRWYRPRSSSPPFPLGGSSIHQSTTMGSWGFDVNRSANGQPPPFTSNNSNNNDSDHRTITRTPRRLDESATTTGGGVVDSSYYNERLVDVSSPPPARFKLRTPTLNRRRDIDDFAVVDRLVLGPNRIADYQQSQPIDDSPRQQYMSSSRSRQSSTRSILRGRSKSIGDFTASATSPPPQSYQQSQINPNSYMRTQTEHELMAWQNRMLQR